MKLGEMQRYEIAEDENASGEPCMFPAADGAYVLFSDAQAKSLADERRIAALTAALEAILPHAETYARGEHRHNLLVHTPFENACAMGRAALRVETQGEGK